MSTNGEAPISVTIQTYYKGFSMMITKRDPDIEVKPLIKGSMEAIDTMIELGFKPSWNEETNKQALGQEPNSRPVEEEDKYMEEDRDENPDVQKKDYCAIHKAKMFEKHGQYGTFYSHGEKQADGSWRNCSGNGYK